MIDDQILDRLIKKMCEWENSAFRTYENCLRAKGDDRLILETQYRMQWARSRGLFDAIKIIQDLSDDAQAQQN